MALTDQSDDVELPHFSEKPKGPPLKIRGTPYRLFDQSRSSVEFDESVANFIAAKNDLAEARHAVAVAGQAFNEAQREMKRCAQAELDRDVAVTGASANEGDT